MTNAKKELLDWIKALIIAVILVIIVRTFVFSNYVVFGESMMPTVQQGNRLIINKIVYKVSEPKRFDMIVFHANPTEDYIKRVIGLPGDTLEYKHDTLYINGKPYEEKYLDPYKAKLVGEQLTEDFTLEEKTGQKTIPKGYLFVMGDNRRKSYDSRHIGLVPMNKVVGKANLRYWPMNEFQIMK